MWIFIDVVRWAEKVFITGKKIGVIAVLAASLMWAVEPVFAKLAYRSSDFFQTSVIRAVFAVLTAGVYVILVNRGDFRVTREQVPKLVYIGVVGTVVADLLYFFSLTKTPVVNAVLIGHMQPVFIILLGFFVLKGDKLTRFDYAGVLIMITSGFLVTTKNLGNLSAFRIGTFGDLFVLIATFAWATAAIVMRRHLKNINSGVLTFYRFLTASIVFFTYLLFSFPKTFLLNFYQIIIGVIVGTGTILYYEGLKRLKAAQVSALELSAPFFAALTGFMVLGETVTSMQLLGIFLLTFGIYFLSKKEKKSGF